MVRDRVIFKKVEVIREFERNFKLIWLKYWKGLRIYLIKVKYYFKKRVGRFKRVINRIFRNKISVWEKKYNYVN